MAKHLGRRAPTDWKHVEKYPLSAVAAVPSFTVEHILALPSWHWSHDQGHEGSCVGHGTAMERSITNIAQAKAAGLTNTNRRYNPLWQWDRAKEIDEWPDTNPGDDNGTSVRAAYDVARTLGVEPVFTMRLDSQGDPYAVAPKPPLASDGVVTNRWATTTDEIRYAVHQGIPVTIGVNWYTGFDSPAEVGYQRYAIGASNLGSIRGGHCVCIYGASDKYQAFKIKNSWGKDYPLAWLPYSVMQRLLGEDGEACLVTDK